MVLFSFELSYNISLNETIVSTKVKTYDDKGGIKRYVKDGV